MTQILSEDIAAIRAELAKPADEMTVALHLTRSLAEKILSLLDAEQTAGAIVVPAKQEFTTNEAAAMLGISRPTLMRLIRDGEIECNMVRSHHRIPVASLAEFQKKRNARQEEALEALAEFSNDIGFNV